MVKIAIVFLKLLFEGITDGFCLTRSFSAIATSKGGLPCSSDLQGFGRCKCAGQLLSFLSVQHYQITKTKGVFLCYAVNDSSLKFPVCAFIRILPHQL